MAFPLLKSGSPADTTSSSTNSLVAPFGTTVAAGDYVVLLVASEGDPAGSFTTPSGWTREFYEGPGFLCRLAVYHKLCDGSEGTSVTIANTLSVRMSSRAFVFTADSFTGIPEFSALTINSSPITDSSDPPALSPSFGAQDAFWLAVLMMQGTNQDNATTYPTGWGNTSRVSEGGMGSFYRIATASKEQSVSSDDPSAFGWISSTGNMSFTMALQGVEETPSLSYSFGGLNAGLIL